MTPTRPNAGERGATASEYALLAFGIAVVIAATVFTLGDDVRGFYESAVEAFASLGR
ncbi:Flp family type IVb pilin [Nocardioides litoris]|uniref:Flp family type IVb pilin n=1 Tax=Nocardioides litoris TaxID=1926648 RepID=UPI001476B3CD|nr:Flp family type IVb pilin [Nocardioides litoris]